MRLRVVPVKSATFLRYGFSSPPYGFQKKTIPVEISRQMVPARRAGNLLGKPASPALGNNAPETLKRGMDLGMDLLKIPTRYIFFNFEDSHLVLFVVVKICIDDEINFNQHSPTEI